MQTGDPVLLTIPADAYRLKDSDAVVPGGSMANLYEALRTAQALWTAGAIVGAAGEAFGHIRDVTSITDEIVLLDALMSQLIIYRWDGGLRGVDNPDDYGLGTLARAIALDVTSDKRMVVAYPRRLGIFGYTDSGAVLQSTVTTPDMPLASDLCVIEDEIILRLSGSDRPELVMAIDTAGDNARMFGVGESASNPQLQRSLNTGYIECIQESKVIVVAFRHQPVVHGYALSGDLLWTTHFDDFLPIEQQEVAIGANSGVRRVYDRPHDEVRRIKHVRDDLFVVQVARYSAYVSGEPVRPKEMKSYLLSATTGEGVYAGVDIPEILYADGRQLVAVHRDPDFDFEQITAYSYDYYAQ